MRHAYTHVFFLDRWRHSLDASRPPDDWLRAFTRVEMRLQIRYGSVELAKMVDAMRIRAYLRKNPGMLLGLMGVALLPIVQQLFRKPASQSLSN